MSHFFKLFSFFFILFLYGNLYTSTTLFAQQTTTVTGSVTDSLNSQLGFASVLLLSPADSAMLTFTRADEFGHFEFKGVKQGATYLLKITYVGYIPYQQPFTTTPQQPVIDLGKISLKSFSKELFEVVVKTARAPISIKGDTIEYNAASFKVPPGSSVEDLLKKLPGFEVNQDGTLKAQGQDVSKVTVDNKRFFGNDTKMATQNLPAEAISKVQVFNDKTEQAKITGIEDGKSEKTVNLALKEEFKKGGFGKITAGYGTDNRLMAKGNYNKFDNKNQFSVIGYGNNLNQTGLSNDDYEDFKGSQSFNWGDDADFGFSGSGRGKRFWSSGGGGEESFSIPRSWGGNGNGESVNYGAGINYNYDTPNRKFSSSYFYNQTEQENNAKVLSQNILAHTYYQTTDTNSVNSFSGNHRATVRFEQTIDSIHTFVVVGNGRLGNRNNTDTSFTEYQTPNQLIFRNQSAQNSSDVLSYAANGTAIYRLKFKKKGRNFALSGSYFGSNLNNDAFHESITNNFVVPDPIFNFGNNVFNNINQNDQNDNSQTELKSSVLYTDKIHKYLHFETFYNFRQCNNLITRNVYNLLDANTPRIDSLSSYYNNSIAYNRLGTSLRFNYKGVSIGAGVAAQQYNLDGQYRNQKGAALMGEVNNTYFLWIPNFELNYSPKNGRNFSLEYDVTVTEPDRQQLQPFADNSNPLYIRKGNPELLPEVSHAFEISYRMFNRASFISLFVNAEYNYFKNQIVNNQTIDAKLVTTVVPVNISGGNSFWSFASFGFPIIKSKLSVNTGANVNFSENKLYINNIANNNQTQVYGGNLRLELTPVEAFSFSASGRSSVTYNKYSVNNAQNNQYYNHSLGSEFTLKFPKYFYFNTNFNYSVYINEKYGFNQQQPILTLAAYKLFGKGNKSELRLTAYDLLNKGASIEQYTDENTVTQSQSKTLTRYYMLAYTYNMRGVTIKTRREGGGMGWW
jgi:hypothetical protein